MRETCLAREKAFYHEMRAYTLDMRRWEKDREKHVWTLKRLWRRCSLERQKRDRKERQKRDRKKERDRESCQARCDDQTEIESKVISMSPSFSASSNHYRHHAFHLLLWWWAHDDEEDQTRLKRRSTWNREAKQDLFSEESFYSKNWWKYSPLECKRYLETILHYTCACYRQLNLVWAYDCTPTPNGKLLKSD